MSDIHWFARPGQLAPDHPGTFNPVYELLDQPIVMGRADDLFLEARDNTGEPVSLSFEDALDRVAKIGGVLALMGASAGATVRLAADLSELAAELITLGAVRIGACPVSGDTALADSSAPPAVAIAASATAEGVGSRDVHRAFSRPVRALRSCFEGAEAQLDDQTLSLDTAVRDARIEPAAAAELPADLIVGVDSAGRGISALDWLRSRSD